MKIFKLCKKRYVGRKLRISTMLAARLRERQTKKVVKTKLRGKKDRNAFP